MDFHGPWSLWANYSYANSYDALTVYPGYEILDPSVKSDSKGTLTNRIMDGGIAYRFYPERIFDRLQVGIGWFDYIFLAKEHGCLETRDYSGVEAFFQGEKRLNDRLIVHGNLQFAPTLAVADNVKGDYDNPDRKANTAYGGYFWATKLGLRVLINPRMWLESGFTYQVLHGEGHEHPDYRFLEHDYNRSGFYALFGTRFFGASNPFRRIRLKGLDPDKNYRIGGEEPSFGGDVLMNAGINIPEPKLVGDFQSVCWHLKAIEGS